MSRSTAREYLYFANTNLCDRHAVTTSYCDLRSQPADPAARRHGADMIWGDLDRFRQEAEPLYLRFWSTVPGELVELDMLDTPKLVYWGQPLVEVRNVDQWGFLVLVHEKVNELLGNISNGFVTRPDIVFVNQLLALHHDALDFNYVGGATADGEREPGLDYPRERVIYDGKALYRRSIWQWPVSTQSSLGGRLTTAIDELANDLIAGQRVKLCAICSSRYFIPYVSPQIRCPYCPKSRIAERWRKLNPEKVASHNQQQSEAREKLKRYRLAKGMDKAVRDFQESFGHLRG